MTRRVLTLLAAAALLAVTTGSANAAVPEGPRLAATRWSTGPESFEILSMNPVGGAAQSIVAGDVKQLPLPIPIGPPAWSPDGNLIAFTGAVGLPHGGRNPLPAVQIFLVRADGSELHAVPGTEGGYDPIFSPDGHTLAFTRERQLFRWERRKRRRGGGQKVVYEGATAWLLDLAGGSPRQLTGWRNHVVTVTSSFSPDGKVLGLSRRVGQGRYACIALRLDGSGSSVLCRNGFAPVYSPDGSTVIFLRGHRRTFRRRSHRGNTTTERIVRTTVTDLFSMRADGSGVRRLTDTPRLAESGVSWNQSGERIAYLADFVGPNNLGPIDNTIMEANPDGTCPTSVLTGFEAAYLGLAWQPGPGRAVGRIAC